MHIFDEDSANDAAFEERHYRLWQREQKNRILNIRNAERRQAEWNAVFPPVEKSDDSWMECATVW